MCWLSIRSASFCWAFSSINWAILCTRSSSSAFSWLVLLSCCRFCSASFSKASFSLRSALMRAALSSLLRYNLLSSVFRAFIVPASSRHYFNRESQSLSWALRRSALSHSCWVSARVLVLRCSSASSSLEVSILSKWGEHLPNTFTQRSSMQFSCYTTASCFSRLPFSLSSRAIDCRANLSPFRSPLIQHNLLYFHASANCQMDEGEGWLGFAVKYIISLKGFSSTFIFIMSNQSICIDSPFFRLPPFHPILRTEAEPQPEEEPEIPLFRFMLSPDILPPALGPVSSLPPTPRPLPLCGGGEKRGREITLPSVFEGEGAKAEAIEERLVFSEMEEDYELMTPVRGEELLLKEENSSLELLTTGRKPDSEPLQCAEPRHCRPGLRRLTAKAYRIVQDVRNASYKEVAERLVREVKHCEADLGEEREEQNVKRRVYDALNVLVAVGVLRREGRKVAAPSHQKRGKTKTTLHQLEIEQLQAQIAAKEGRVEALRQKLREAEEKLQSVRWLLGKNRQGGQRKDSSVPFPFVGITAPASLCAEQLSQSQVVIRSERPIRPFGDMDCLRWLI